MDVDHDSIAQAWQNLKVEELYIAVLLANVAGIDEKHIIGGQRLECAQTAVLHFALSQANAVSSNQLSQLVVDADYGAKLHC